MIFVPTHIDTKHDSADSSSITNIIRIYLEIVLVFTRANRDLNAFY